MWLEEESRSFTHCCSPKSRQQEIKEELAQQFKVEKYQICFSHNPPEKQVIYSEHVDSVGCVLHFWVEK